MNAQGFDAHAAFERALIAVSYLLGRRGEDLGREVPVLSPDTYRLVGALGHAERSERARVLAGELARVVQSLERRRLK